MERKAINRLCFSLLLSVIVMYFSAGTIGSILTLLFSGSLHTANINKWLNSAAFIATAISLVFCWLVFRQMTKGIYQDAGPKQKLSAKVMILMFLSGYGISNILAYIGVGANMGITYLITGEMKSLQDVVIVSDAFKDTPIFLVIAYAVIVGPLLEELIFRKILVSKLKPFGYAVSVVVSGILFGAYHLNLEQFFYAAFLGMILAAIYYRTNNILYSYIIHAAFNFSSVLLTIILADYQTAVGYFSIILNIAGIVCFIIFGAKWLVRKPVETHYVITARDLWLNPGMIVYLLFALFASVFTVVSMNI